MKLILALLCLLIAPVSRADEPLSFPTLTTTQGVIYHEVKVTKFDALQVKFIHRNGVATVPLAELPANVQKIFGYDPVNASFEMILKQEERRKHIIEDAGKKAKHAALIEQERLDTEELQSIRDHVLRCCVQDISETESGPLIYVLPVAKLPIKLKSRSGKYERVKLTPLGKPELVEQIVAGQEFSLGPTIRLLPAPTFLARSTMISVYLVEAEPGSPAICSVTPEDALKYRRKIAQYKEQQKEAEKKAQTKP